MGLSASVRTRRPDEVSFCVVPLRDHPQHDPGKSFRSIRAMRRLKKPSVRRRPWRIGSGASDCTCAAIGAGPGEAIRRGMIVSDRKCGNCKCDASSKTLFFVADRILFCIVTQCPAGGLVDEMDPGTRRAGHGLIAIRIVRCGIGHVNLNIHAGPRAAKYQLGHFLFWCRGRPCALICLKVA